MAQLRIALAQLNVTVGDIAGNADLILDWSRRAADAEAQLVLFPEMALTGYPVEDLALRQSFIAESRRSVDRLAERLAADGLGELVVVVGYLDRTDEPDHPKGGHPQNVAAVLHRGTVVAPVRQAPPAQLRRVRRVPLLRTGPELAVVTVGGVDVAVAICEDLWQDGGPVAAAAEAGAGLLAVINASPYERDKDDIRGELVSRRAVEARCALAYVNLVGGQDELVFDGDSMIAAADGTLVVRGPQFVEDLVLADLDLPDSRPADGRTVSSTEKLIISRHHVTDAYPPPARPITAPRYPRLSAEEEVYSALVLGLRDYCGKNGIERVYLGLSGGIDSTLVAAIACDAIGAEHVYGISNPSAYSSEHSKTDAADLAARLGLNYSTVPIAAAVDTFNSLIDIDGIAAENLQARIRGRDLDGRVQPARPVDRARLRQQERARGRLQHHLRRRGRRLRADQGRAEDLGLASWPRWRNDHATARDERPPIPENTITKEPSAELRPGQKDTDSCRRTTCWTRSSPTTSRATRAGPRSSPPATTPNSSTG